MAASKPTTAELVELVIRRAPALYAAGVRSIAIDGFSFVLADPPSALDLRGLEVPDAPAHAEPGDPLSDPSTYPGGRVPGFQRPRKDDR